MPDRPITVDRGLWDRQDRDQSNGDETRAYGSGEVGKDEERMPNESWGRRPGNGDRTKCLGGRIRHRRGRQFWGAHPKGQGAEGLFTSGFGLCFIRVHPPE